MSEVEPLSEALAAIQHRLSERPPIPTEFFCTECHYLVNITDEKIVDWFTANRPILIPLSYVMGCRCIDEDDFAERQRQRQIANMNLPKRGGTGPRTFENFDDKLAGTREMLEVVKAWADGTLRESFLTMIGITGCGKSHLLEAAVAHMNERGMSARYERAEDVLNMLRATYSHSDDEQDIQDVMQWYDRFDALIIDDLGANRATEWGVGYIYLMLDKRYADGRMLAIGTNIRNAKQMEKAWDARIASRCFDRNSGVVKVLWSEAADYRKASL